MIPRLILRYSFSISNGHRARVIRIIITLTLSLLALSSVLAVMNYLQHSRFDDIRRVKSFDVVVSGDKKEELKALFPECSVFLYGEGEALIDGSAYLVRYIDDDYDGELRFLRGDSSSLLIPYYLYRDYRKESYNVTMIQKGKSGRRVPKSSEMSISGIYSTPLGREFDSAYVFMPLSIFDGDVKTAIKGNPDLALLDGYEYKTWKDSESSLYSAFLIEKTMMYSVMSLLFIIIGVSAKQSVRIFYKSKEKERAELIVLGLERRCVNAIFSLSFILITAISILLALLLSYLMMPLLSAVITSMIASKATLSIPYSGFFIFSLLSLIMAFIFTLSEMRRDKKRELLEVIHG